MNHFSKLEQILASEPDPAFARRAKIIIKSLNISGNERLLDLGCGRGFYLKTLSYLYPKLKLYGVDLNEKYLKIARKFLPKKNTVLAYADAQELPFKDNYFEKIIASEILEHLHDDEKALVEIFRVLKPGGKVLISVPNKNYPFLWDPTNWLLEKILKTHIPSNVWWLAGIWAGHIRLYGEKELTGKIEKVGFRSIKSWRTTHYCLPFSHFLLYGIGKNIVELGFLGDFNRFEKRSEQSILNKAFLFPLRLIDRLNKDRLDFKSSVSIILKAEKPKR